MATNYPKGSEWRKWDLHVHTPSSAIAHSLGDDWNMYVEKLIEAAKTHGVSAIATADYFSIEGYRQLLKYYNKSTHTLSVNNKSTEIEIIPGVELRLNIFNSDEDSVNIHVFFDPSCCSPDFIESNFLEGLKVNYRGAEHPLKSQNLYAIGKSIVNGDDIAVGADFSTSSEVEKLTYKIKALSAITLIKKDIGEALKEIDEIFERQKLPPKAYLIAVVGKGHGGINSLKWFEDNKQNQFSRAGLVREDLTHQADIIFSNDPNDIDFYLGKNSATPPQEVHNRFSNLKPCVWGSDSHTLEHLLHPSNGNTTDYTWIKAEVCFEGLKQITFEPELRVKVQTDNPNETETYALIEKSIIKFPSDLKIQDKESTEEIDFCLRGTYEVELSNNLTCIIGGRGSGKSTLVHILYNSWVHRDLSKLIQLNSPLTNLVLSSKDPLGKVQEMVTTNIPESTEFYLQNEIEKFAKDIQEMSKLVRHRLERLSSLDESKKSLSELKNAWENSSSNLDELISSYNEITKTDKEIDLLKKQIITLKKQTAVIKSKEYQSLQKQIEILANAISNFESFSIEQKKLVDELSQLTKTVQGFNWSDYDGQDLLTKIQSGLISYKREVKNVYEAEKKKFDTKDFKNKLTLKKAELKKYLSDKGLSSENIDELADASQQIASLSAEIQILNEKSAPFNDVYAQKGEILAEYKKCCDNYHKRFFEVSLELQNNLGGLKFSEHQTEITFSPKTNEKLLRDKVANFVKTHNSLSGAVLNTDNIQSVLFENSFSILELVSNKANILKAVNNSQKATVHTQVLQEMVNDEKFLEKLCLRMHKYYYDIANIQVQAKLGEKLLQSTSFGERCGIVIAIILVAGTNPIVIDQPEDNLDGKFISNVLVPLIRKQKKNRQIVLVTRDANLVIGSDAELLHILDCNDAGKTKIIPATIENKKARSKYIWILDGGEQAFKNREKKYSLS